MLDTKAAVSRPDLVRLDNISMGKTAVKEVHHVFNDYIQNNPRAAKDYEENMWEDVEFLVEQFNSKIGSSYSAIRRRETFNNFSGRGHTSTTSGSAKMAKVREDLPAWIQHLKSTNLIFDEPDIERVVQDHNVVLDFHDDLPEEPAPPEDAPPPAADHSAKKWCDSHPPTKGETKVSQLDQAKAIMSEGQSRKRVLWEKKQEQLRVAAAAEEAEAERRAVRAVARTEKVYTVEQILNKRDNGGVVEYRVKWMNHAPSHNSWEPAEGLTSARQAVARYEKQHKNKK